MNGKALIPSFVFLVPFIAMTAQAQSIGDCKKITVDQDRLACYDKLDTPVPAKPVAAPKAKAAPDKFSAAKQAVIGLLKDPQSAQFKEIYDSKKAPGAICGLVNAKNSMGGYSGFKAFIYVGSTKQVFLLDQNAAPQTKLDGLQAFPLYCEYPLIW